MSSVRQSRRPGVGPRKPGCQPTEMAASSWGKSVPLSCLVFRVFIYSSINLFAHRCLWFLRSKSAWGCGIRAGHQNRQYEPIAIEIFQLDRVEQHLPFGWFWFGRLSRRCCDLRLLGSVGPNSVRLISFSLFHGIVLGGVAICSATVLASNHAGHHSNLLSGRAQS